MLMCTHNSMIHYCSSGLPGQPAYCASKFAVEGYSDVLRLDMAQWGCTVHIIEPGVFPQTGLYVRTNLTLMTHPLRGGGGVFFFFFLFFLKCFGCYPEEDTDGMRRPSFKGDESY